MRLSRSMVLMLDIWFDSIVVSMSVAKAYCSRVKFSFNGQPEYAPAM